MVVVVDQDTVGAPAGAEYGARRRASPDKTAGPNATDEFERRCIEQINGVIFEICEDVCADVVLDKADIEAGRRGRRPYGLVEGDGCVGRIRRPAVSIRMVSTVPQAARRVGNFSIVLLPWNCVCVR